MTAPRLVFAIGNASRGDDALGPALAALLRDEGWFDGAPEPRAELIEVYQLQVEDALELAGRDGVLFVDAARAPEQPPDDGVALRALSPGRAPPFSHALEPGTLLEVYRRVCGEPPPAASVLAIVGASFELGAPLSAAARSRLPRALALARDWLGAPPRAAAVPDAPDARPVSSASSVSNAPNAPNAASAARPDPRSDGETPRLSAAAPPASRAARG